MRASQTPQRGHSKPWGQRLAIRAASQSFSVPYKLRNFRIDSPGWNCTRFIGMAHLLGGCGHPRFSLAHCLSLLNFIANQVAICGVSNSATAHKMRLNTDLDRGAGFGSPAPGVVETNWNRYGQCHKPASQYRLSTGIKVQVLAISRTRFHPRTSSRWPPQSSSTRRRFIKEWSS